MHDSVEDWFNFASNGLSGCQQAPKWKVRLKNKSYRGKDYRRSARENIVGLKKYFGNAYSGKVGPFMI